MGAGGLSPPSPLTLTTGDGAATSQMGGKPSPTTYALRRHI